MFKSIGRTVTTTTITKFYCTQKQDIKDNLQVVISVNQIKEE